MNPPFRTWHAYNEETKLICFAAENQTQLFTQVSLWVAQHEHEGWFFEMGGVEFDPFKDDLPFATNLYAHR